MRKPRCPFCKSERIIIREQAGRCLDCECLWGWDLGSERKKEKVPVGEETHG
jgi:hypothetical protein